MDKKSMVLTVAALAAAFLIGANTNTVPDEIRAKKFIVVNDDGKEVIVLSSNEYSGVMAVFDKNGPPDKSKGKGAAMIAVDENGGSIVLLGKNGKMTAGISSDKYGRAMDGFGKSEKGPPETSDQISNNKNGGSVVAYEPFPYQDSVSREFQRLNNEQIRDAGFSGGH